MKILVAGDFCPQDCVAEAFEQGKYEDVLGEFIRANNYITIHKAFMYAFLTKFALTNRMAKMAYNSLAFHAIA